MEKNIKQDIELIVVDSDIKLLVDGKLLIYSGYKNLNITLKYFKTIELYVEYCKKVNRSLKDYEG